MAEQAARAKVAVLISGRGSNMAALLYAAKAADCPFDIVLVAANDPDAPGLALAAAEGVATFAQSHVGLKRAEFDAIIDAEIRKAGAQYIALAGYMRLLSPEFVGRWEGRMLNIHPSLLPKYKGLHTHERALEAGDSHAGCSVHIVTAELDDGPVLGQTEVAILPSDTPDTLAARTLIAEHQLYSRVLGAYVSRYANPDWIIGQVDRLASALPEVAQRLSHGAPGWRTGEAASAKFFAYVSVRHHGEDAIALLVKTDGQDEMAALIEADPDIYYRPDYYGTSGWIAIRLDRPDTDWGHVDQWLRRSWQSVAPKRLARLAEWL
ncbi:phosphoribosylglycinamide formyltransferase [Sphingobium subterraneum]|uniref:Phosphoribosylglycinamide formyltransferase n=1 Tax=Sphingobium subterraneum TaxID=627688 RepID=A0A841J1K8_9SPHN|nr:phosphoribosylglycinamide formyltransferase [Sphingobium subterraneum]MBB6125059.1 phosphoribosylglycinamide formyltransferase-1 [Sphingobium subterraneum]